ncbi:EthD domain-containing protein [bacterium]|nr:EthD domain-containing protein [bacterium]
MIHQLIFANPKPGWTADQFLDYWLNVHAVKYASKIPQIVLYKVDCPVKNAAGLPGRPLPYAGVAEIWLENDQTQLASLQSPEFIDGARRDEPNWAAFWETFALDTDPVPVLPGPPEVRPAQGVKLLTLWKRKPGMELGDFRTHLKARFAQQLRDLSGLRRLLVGTVRDGFYAVGEAKFDAATHLWFDTPEAAASGVAEFPGHDEFAEPRYTFSLLLRENWVIGPELRAG